MIGEMTNFNVIMISALDRRSNKKLIVITLEWIKEIMMFLIMLYLCK